MANFFIDRPIFAWVLAILLCLTGTLAIFSLPVEQYPDLAPPNVRVTANYPGASAQTLENTVTQVIEQNMTGLDNLMYMSSQSSGTGQASVTLSFKAGTDPDEAVQQVQNQLQSAMRKLPQAVQNQGVTVRKTGDTNILTIAFVSTDGSMDKQDIADYVASNIQDPLSRVNGVGDIDAYGSQYSMRIWLDPAKLNSFQMTAKDVTDAIESQNAQIAVGQLGGTPSVDKQALNATINAQSLLQTPEQFRDITLRVNQDGSEVRLGDVATVEMGAEKYDYLSRFNGKPASGLGVKLASGANEMATAELVLNRLDELAQYFPHGLEYKVAYETTSFVKASIEDVVKTLLEAIALVFLVMYLFLQNFRATLIPTIAVPVVLMGTFSVLYAFGYSVNTLTMFAMVLAIGLLVDDAIVVVENVERNMSEKAMNPIDATILAMSEVSGPIIATVLVLASVFVPAAFMGGTTGMLYKQFAITIAISVSISGFVALTLTPALCAAWLSHEEPKTHGFFFRFNQLFGRLTVKYGEWTRALFRRTLLVIILFAGMGVAIFQMFRVLPTGFVPSEDQGYVLAAIMLPSSASLQRSTEAMDAIEKALDPVKGIETKNSIGGFSLLDGGVKTNAGTFFMTLAPFDERYKNSQTAKEMSADAIMQQMQYRGMASQMQALVVPINPPAIPGLGTTGGFEFWIQDTGSGTPQQLGDVLNNFLQKARQRPELTGLTSTYNANNQQLKINFDRDKAQLLGLSTADVFNTLQSQFGSAISSQFSQFSRVWFVIMQSEPKYRAKPEDIDKLYVRNSNGEMIPLSAVITTEYTNGATSLPHYNGFPAAQVIGNAAPGYSSGQGMKALEEVAAEVLPPGYTYGWTGISYEQQSSGSSSAIVFGFGLLLVFLVLAAQYESWALPGSVILAVPFGVIGALLATWARGLENDVYFQIGMLVMIGLAAKNAILIVEFAVELRHKGMDLVRAAIDAGELRFRPIIMTSLAFIGGTIPLAVATGAGAASRHSLGTGIVGGMIGVSTLALLFVPIFYVWFEGWAERSGAKSALKLAAKLSSRNIPITDKLRTAILRGPGTVYDPNATVKVSPSGELTVINSPGFNPEGVENQDIGIGDLTSQEQKANVESADKLTDLEREKSVKEDKTEITKEVLFANEVSQKAADAKNNKGEGK